MSYKGKTKFCDIPYITDGEYLSEYNEKEQLEIIDKLLFLNNYFYPNCVIKEGNFSLLEDEENVNVMKLTLTPKDGFSFMVIIKNKLYYCNETLSFDLFKGEKYYLYIDVDFNNNNNVYKTILTKSTVNYKAVLLCEVDLTYNKQIINIHHKEKIYLNNMKKHVYSNENPHGILLKQDEIMVNNLIVSGEKIYKTLYKVVDITKNVLIVDVKNVIFVNVMPMDDIGTFYVKLAKNNFTVFTEKNGKCKLEIKVEE